MKSGTLISLLLLPAAALAGGAKPPLSSRDNNSPCCTAIAEALPGKVISQKSNSAAYKDEKSSYWTVMENEISPACFVQPETVEDVASAMKILGDEKWQNEVQCKFAIRSGGHTPWPGAANQQDGVTIDLTRLKEVTVSDDKKTVQLGPGNRWGEVYNKLAPLGIAVAGGRWGNVGVGGLFTGGGISWYQGEKGPGCDSIFNHQVVLANGSIVNANSEQNADLHRALKGGNNNFGIVTRFDVRAYPTEKIWGGMAAALLPKKDALQWWQKFANSSTMDPHSMALLIYANVGDNVLVAGEVAYTKPTPNPEIFRELTKSTFNISSLLPIPNISPLLSGVSGLLSNAVPLFGDAAKVLPEGFNALDGHMSGITTYNDFATLNGITTSGVGGRFLFSSFSFVNSAEYMGKLLDLHDQHNKKLPFLGASGISVQPLWRVVRQNTANAGGGNVLGFDDTNPDDDLVIVGLFIGYLLPNDYDAVRKWTTAFIDAAHQLAKEMGVFSPYIYANYAAGFQDVISGYGKKSKEFLKTVSVKYDPTQVFQKRVPGGYKLEAV